MAKKSEEKKGFFKTLTNAVGAEMAKKIVAVMILAVVILGVGIGVGSRVFISSNMTQFDLKAIGELATQAGYYTNVEIIEDSKKLWKITLPFTSSKYIFSYDGIIKAGIDFEEIEWSVNDVTKKITVKLPEMKILSNEIDTNSLYVYDESRSIFSPLTVNDINDSLISLKAESEEKAIGNGILEEAEENAKVLIQGFLAGSYPDYEIVYKE